MTYITKLFVFDIKRVVVIIIIELLWNGDESLASIIDRKEQNI